MVTSGVTASPFNCSQAHTAFLQDDLLSFSLVAQLGEQPNPDRGLEDAVGKHAWV